MTLSINNPFNKGYFGKGIYISKATVILAEDISNTKPEHMQRTVDLGIKLTLDIGKDFNPEMIIAGNFERDETTNEVIGFGSAWVVADALNKLGYSNNLDNSNSIPKDSLDELIGKSFYKLAYVSGLKDDLSYKYSNWYVIGAIEDGAQHLYERFQKSYAKGYPSNYRPELTEAESMDIENEEVKSEINKQAVRLSISNNGFDDFDTINQY